MARDELAISHATFEAIPLDRAVTYVREMLAAVGVLPPYHPSVERITLWLDDTVCDLPKDRADLVRRFARWQLLHRLRRLGERDNLTRSGVQAARATILTAIRFLAWLDTQQVELPDVGQSHLDRYLAAHAGHGPALRLFLDWTSRSGVTASLTVPYTPRSEPEVALSDTQRWAHVEVLLHDDTVRLYTRVAGLFILLFAQPLSRVLRMRPEQIARREDGTVTVQFDTFPIELPEPLEELALRQLDASQNERFAGHHRKWLFPGRNAGRHLVRENIRSELVARGIHPAAGRNAALFQLAAQVPTPVLAELLGIAPSTATRWAALAARDWSHYASLRRTHTTPNPQARGR